MITAKDVQTLRQKTGAGMMECKRALEENKGDMQKSEEYLRVKGIAKAEKRAMRELTRSPLRVNFNLPAGRNPPPAAMPAAFF